MVIIIIIIITSALVVHIEQILNWSGSMCS